MEFTKFIYSENYNLKGVSYTLKFDFNIRSVGSSRNTFDCYSTLLYFLKGNPQKEIFITQTQIEDFYENEDQLVINLEKYQEFCNKIGKDGENRAQAFFSRRIQHFSEAEKKALISQSEETEIIDWINSLTEIEKESFSEKIKLIEGIRIEKNITTKTNIEELIKSFNQLDINEINKLLSEQKFDKQDFVNISFRKRGLEDFKKKLERNLSNEKTWQTFFQEHKWIFGYGLDYRFMTIFDREVSVGDGGTQNKDKPNVDFLNELSDFTVLVELKTPKTQFFTKNSNRSGCWEFSTEFINAFSQTLEQKAEWQIKGNQSNNLSNDGSRKLEKRTRDPKTLLVIGNKQKQIIEIENFLEKTKKEDTFELFRRDSRNIEIITFDELYERAYFIVYNQPCASLEIKEEIQDEDLPF